MLRPGIVWKAFIDRTTNLLWEVTGCMGNELDIQMGDLIDGIGKFATKIQ